MPKTYKWSDRHIFSDRFMMEFSYAHVGNNFALTFHEDDLRDVQPAFDVGTSAYARSYLESVYVRPTDSIDILGNYFVPGWLGGDHALKFGFKYRNDIAHSETTYGGKTIARFTSFATMAPNSAQMYRDSITEYQLFNRNLYFQDSITRNKMTINLGLRFDYQTDEAHEANVAAHPFYGKASYAGVYSGVTYTGATFNQLPALTFPGADSGGVSFKNWSPRIGFTYDLLGDGRNVFKVNYSRYVSQLGTGTLSSTYNTVTTASVRYPWVDLNNDKFVQANEVVMTATPLTYSGNYDPNNPTAASSPGTNDKGLKGSTTDEFIIGFDKAIGNKFAVSASYIWRNYANFQWSDRTNFSSADYVAVQYHAHLHGGRHPLRLGDVLSADEGHPGRLRLHDAARLPRAATRGSRFPPASGWRTAGAPNVSYSYNDAPQHYDSANAYEDPTNIDRLNGGQYAPESTSSGLGNVFVNAKWIFRASGVSDPVLGHQLRRLLQLPQRLPVPPGHPDAEPRERRRHHVSVPGPARRQPSADVPGSRLPHRQELHACQPGEDRAGDGHLQPAERQHGALDPRHAEREQRQHDLVDPGAPRHPLRREGDVLDSGLGIRDSGFVPRVPNPATITTNSKGGALCPALCLYARNSQAPFSDRLELSRRDASQTESPAPNPESRTSAAATCACPQSLHTETRTRESPLKKLSRLNFSFGACRLSSGRPKPKSTTGTFSAAWKSATTGIDPPSRVNTGRLPKPFSMARPAACM